MTKEKTRKPDNPFERTDQEGFLPIPKWLPQAAINELIHRRVETRGLRRLIDRGPFRDGDTQPARDALWRLENDFNYRVLELMKATLDDGVREFS